MTVEAAALAMSMSSQPSARSVIAGSQGFEYARYVLDASQSGEDVRFSSMVADLESSGTLAGAPANLTSCQLFDGDTALNTSVVDPGTLTNGTATTTDVAATFTFANSLTVPKGTIKTLSLKCNLSSSADTSSTYQWGIRNTAANVVVTGVTSSNAVTETVTASNGIVMTAAASGSYTVTNDTALLYSASQAGTTGVTLANLRFTAGAQEAIDLTQIALQLGNTASNSPADLVGESVTLWNGSTQIGTAAFGGANPDNATSTALSPAPRIEPGESVLITVKGDLTAQNLNDGTPGAFLAITYDGDNVGIGGNYAKGVDSQATISSGTTADVTTNGTRIFRTVPSIAVTSNGGTLVAGGSLYSFTVTNPTSRDIVFGRFSFSHATSGAASINAFTLYGDGVAFNTSATSTAIAETVLQIDAAATSQAKIVPANSSKTYVVKAATVTNPSTAIDQITLALLADTSYPSLANNMGTFTTADAGVDNTDNIIWSPFSTTTPVATSATEDNLDWTNGYGMPGFPSNTAFGTQTWSSAN